MDKPVRIIIADDHPIFRKGLVEVIRGDKGFTLLGEASDGRAAWDMIQRLKPDVAVLDIDMPERNGLALAREVQLAKLETGVVILTIHKEENIFNSALDLGVTGYVLKEDAVQDLSKAIRAVTRGEVFLSSAISSFLLNRARRMEKLQAEEPGLSRLTPTEVRVLTFVAENQTNEEIGRQLFISARTVHTHRNNICTKLNLHGARGLLLFALEHREELRSLRLLPGRMG